MTRPDSCVKIPGLTKMMCQKLPPNLKMCKNVKDYETYQNTVTHWWDASQIYGSNRRTNRRVRSGRGGKLVLTQEGRLPLDRSTGLPITGKLIKMWNFSFSTFYLTIVYILYCSCTCILGHKKSSTSLLVLLISIAQNVCRFRCNVRLLVEFLTYIFFTVLRAFRRLLNPVCLHWANRFFFSFQRSRSYNITTQ